MMELHNVTEIVQLAILFFIVINPVGNSPTIASLVKEYPLAKQRFYLLREGLMGFILTVLFLFFGKEFMATLNLASYTISFCGGILLLLVALQMIYPSSPEVKQDMPAKEPFLVPIATPLLAGAGLFSTILIFSERTTPFIVSTSLLFAWAATTAILYFIPTLLGLIGKRGVVVLEQLMGMILAMISTEMLTGGIFQLIKTFN